MIEISCRTGFTHEKSWKFWMIPFTVGEFCRIKALWRDPIVFHIEKRIWKKMQTKTHWVDLISPGCDGESHILAGVPVVVID